jgi:hypothetical protein
MSISFLLILLVWYIDRIRIVYLYHLSVSKFPLPSLLVYLVNPANQMDTRTFYREFFYEYRSAPISSIFYDTINL